MSEYQSENPRAAGPTGDNGASRPISPSSDEGFTLRDMLGIVWRRKWILILIVVVATAAAYIFSSLQTPVYQATASLIYESAINISNPLTGSSYQDAATRELDLRSVGSVLASPDMQKRTAAALRQEGFDNVLGQASVTTEVQTSDTNSIYSSVVHVIAEGGNPEVVAAVANAYAGAFVTWRKERYLTQITSAIDALDGEIAQYKLAFEARNKKLAPEDRTRLEQSTEFLVLQERLRDLEILKSTTTGNFRVLVPASVPTSPIAPQPLRSAILGFGIGLFAALGLIFLLEQFNTQIRHTDEITAILHQPVIGRIPRIPQEEMKAGALVTIARPDSTGAEAFRTLRTNLDFVGLDGSIRSFAITSCLQGEGKSYTIANLAVSLALAGKRVIIVDADLRRPRLHKLFGLNNSIGLSTAVAGRHEVAAGAQAVLLTPGRNDSTGRKHHVEWHEGAGAARRLYVMTSGPVPPNPGEIASSRRFAEVIHQLEKEADLVLVDTPAMLPVGDFLAIASTLDGYLFLVDPRVVKRPQLREASELLQPVQSKSMGLIVLRAAKSSKRYYYYYRSYHKDSDTEPPTGPVGPPSGSSIPPSSTPPLTTPPASPPPHSSPRAPEPPQAAEVEEPVLRSDGGEGAPALS